ncbi:MAG TPA: methyltransferase domain-containing protein [Polyangiaceae bacterium]|nr:methyltransferase domain-containing protein [Polyangiaceae bacterium]
MNAPDRPAPGPLAVSEPWDLVSEGYAAESAAVMLPFARHAIELARPSATARVLDVATGTGILALELAPSVARIDAVDFAPQMLRQLEQRRRSLGLDNVHAQVADGQALPFADGLFDAAFSMFGLMFFPDRVRGFAELCRVLAPGGVAVVSSWAPIDRSPLMTLMFGALRAADPTRAAPQPNWLSLENPEVFERELAGAGFRDISVRPFTHAVPVESAEQFWDVTTRSSAPLVLLKKRLGPAEWQRQEALALAYLREHLTAATTLSTTAYLGFGRR